MSELSIGSRVQAVTRITNGYGEGQRVVEPGQQGTVKSFSRMKGYPEVEWDAGWSDLARPEQVSAIEGGAAATEGPPKVKAERLCGVIRTHLESLNGSSGLGIAGTAAGAEGSFVVLLQNGQTFTVEIRDAGPVPQEVVEKLPPPSSPSFRAKLAALFGRSAE
jgi:hypothetical protein